MIDLEQEEIHIVSKYSNLSGQSISKALEDNVYNNKTAWQKFLRLFLITVGIGFTVSGIVFFFAYNWADLHKFAKIGLIQGVLTVTISLLLFKVNTVTKNIILLGASVLVGVLFAVFGQVYQTGANAYDFFLAWTVFIAIWVLVSGFAPLWLLFLVLVNLTLLLYVEQVAKDWSGSLVYLILFMVNAGVLIFSIIYGSKTVPTWFLNILVLSAIVCATIAVVSGIFNDDQIELVAAFLITVLLYALGLWYGLKTKNAIYLSLIPFSIIIIVAAFLIDIWNFSSMIGFVGLFVLVGVSLTIKFLIDLHKRWANDK